MEETKINIVDVGIVKEFEKHKLYKVDIQKLNSKKKTLFFKRVVDIVGSTLGLFVAAIIIFFVAIAMKINEPKGPIFFSQIRVGKNEKKFKMYKIRSMCVDAEEKLAELMRHNEIEGAMFKMKDDPRITKVGKFIRKTSIDELPQLWNVLKGEMSLVGPRPSLVREVEEYTAKDKERLLVKPGCTGLWQVSGRNELDFQQMIHLDITYINNLKIKNDIIIIFKTIYVILKPKGAY
ncbi:sugar transferase [Enterococcus bulliens]